MSFRNRDYHLYKSVSFTKKRSRRRKTGVNMALNKWNTNFRLEYSVRKTQDYTFSDVQLLPEISLWNDRALYTIYFPTGFSGNVL